MEGYGGDGGWVEEYSGDGVGGWRGTWYSGDDG